MSQTASAVMQAPYEAEEQGVDLFYYYEVLKKRKLYIVLPFILVFAIGFAVAMLWPPTFLSEGKILVESQQIPADLVRPTVTATAKERLQVIEQRVMTRDNLLTIADKYQLFADQRERLSRTEMLDLMREKVSVKPIELDPQRRRNENVTIAVTVGFSDRRPDIATKIANELMTLFLNEDARNRTNRAMETTKFIAREVQKLEAELAAVDGKILELKKQERASQVETPSPQTTLPQLAMLRAEYAQKSAVFSKSHPELKRLKGIIDALEKERVSMSAPSPSTASANLNTAVKDALDPLQEQRASIQKNLEGASQKLAAARLGENLERDQFSERLEVLEQAVVPQKPIKPNRPKIIALAFLAAAMAGIAAVFAVEMFDRTIRRSDDLLRVSGGHLVVAIPYIATKAELTRKRGRLALAIALPIVAILGTLLAVHVWVRPLDELWVVFMTRLLGSWSGF
jgi:protein tyrosine kinase modulator